jgi:hypothetical protein
MISLLLILLAAIFKAVADTVMWHYDTSVFKRMPFQFWNPRESYKYAKHIPLTTYPVDGWHLANSGMIICFICAAIFHHSVLKWYFEIIIGGVAFNVVFGIFYDHLLRRK